MPEGVEVKLSADVIRPLVVGKEIKAAYSTPNSRYGDSKKGSNILGPNYDSLALYNPKPIVESVEVKGKFMYWTLPMKTRTWYMFNTFGMTGQWSPKQGKHPCFCFEFMDGSSIWFNDQRHFGTIQFHDNKEILDEKISELGWDPLQMSLIGNFDWVKAQLAKTGKGIGEVLMDQGVFAGVGNYIRAEALYLSKLSPFRPANKLSIDEIRILCQSIIKVMESSYEHQGATIQTYKTVYGEEGKYSSLFQVYGKKQGPCGNAIVKQDSGGRTIHWCPATQI